MIPDGLRCCLGQRQVLLRPSDRYCDKFMLYALQAPFAQHQIMWNEGTGSTVSNLRIPVLKALRLPYPANEEQEKRAGVLSSIDARIDHNRALAANLEAIARALFKSWFVGFDPVRAKAADEAPPGLDEDLARLFPDQLVDSEIGEIPGGWEVGTVSDIALNIRDGRRAEDVAGDERYIGLEHFDRRTLRLWRCGSGSEVTSNKSAFETGDLLFGKLRPYFHKVSIAPFAGVCSTDVLVIRPKSPDVACLVYLALSEPAVIDFVTNASTGTKMPRTNWKTLASYRMAVPDGSIAREFHKIASPMLQRMTLAAEEAGTLAELRDLLLPRLISGKLRVSEAEAMVAAIV